MNVNLKGIVSRGGDAVRLADEAYTTGLGVGREESWRPAKPEPSAFAYHY